MGRRTQGFFAKAQVRFPSEHQCVEGFVIDRQRTFAVCYGIVQVLRVAVAAVLAKVYIASVEVRRRACRINLHRRNGVKDSEQAYAQDRKWESEGGVVSNVREREMEALTMKEMEALRMKEMEVLRMKVE